MVEATAEAGSVAVERVVVVRVGERAAVRLAARQQGRLGVRLVRRAAGAGRRRRLDQGRGTSSAAYLRTAVNGAASGTFIL